MKIKIISVRADSNFRAIRIGDQSFKLSANEHLEKEIQLFLDQNPEIEIAHIQYSTIPIIPKTASWETTNSEINWEIEKSVIIIFDEKSKNRKGSK
ncbi:MAG: hypothetical protein HY756_02110 [Nitrospirae bacterium]|nr:hypothetical protein [Nitrospirota bacterium]